MFLSNDDTLHRYDNLRFDVSDLNAALFHPLDIEKFEAKHPLLFPGSPLAQARERIDELERQLQELRQEYESLKAGGSAVESASPDCTACPQNNDQRLEVFKIGVRMALRCAADGSQQSKEAHLALWRELHGGKGVKPNSRYFDALRSAFDEAPHLKYPDPKQK